NGSRKAAHSDRRGGEIQGICERQAPEFRCPGQAGQDRDMTAPELLAELTAQGFCLDVRDDGIGMEPASQLTDAQIQAIREHKVELRILLRGEPAPKAQVTAPNKTKRKPRKRVTKAPVTREEQPTAASQAALPPVEAAGVPSPEPVEAPAPAAA